MDKNLKKCFYCGEIIDITKEDYTKPNLNRYAHKKCHETFIEGVTRIQSSKKKEVTCLYCKKRFILTEDNFKMARINRYAHKECYEKYHTEDDEYIDRIYYTLKVNNIDYNFVKCERQRESYLKEGRTNKGIARALHYFYEVLKGDGSKANGGIGIVPYVYDDATNYYYNLEVKRRQIAQDFGDSAPVNLGQIEPQKRQRRGPKSSLDDIFKKED